MTDVLDKLIACEKAENEGRAYPFFPEIWGEARVEIERLRKALREIKNHDGHCNVIYDADDAIAMIKIARAALGEKE